MQRKVNVVEDLDGNKIVFIHDEKFKGKRSIVCSRWETLFVRHCKYKKGNEQPFPVMRPYSAKNPFLS